MVAHRGRSQKSTQARGCCSRAVVGLHHHNPLPRQGRGEKSPRNKVMTTKKQFAVFDADSHVVESREIWDKYLEPEYRTLGKFALWREEGKHDRYLKVNGKMFRDTMNSNIPRHAIWKPGMTWDQVGELDPHQRHPATAGASDPKARLRDMDAMGVDQAFL